MKIVQGSVGSEPSQLVLDPELLLLEVVDHIVVGVRPALFVGDARFEIRMLALEGIKMWLSHSHSP
jgi:hypothetical protein